MILPVCGISFGLVLVDLPCGGLLGFDVYCVLIVLVCSIFAPV